MKRLMKNFTLIELMIVVAIIAIIATIALPNLMSAQRNSRERGALATLRSVHSDQESYKNDNQTYATLAELAATSGMVNLPATASATPKNGYYYDDIIAVPTQDFYAVIASPSAWGSSGSKHFAVTSVGKVRQDTVEVPTINALTDAEQATITAIEAFDDAK